MKYDRLTISPSGSFTNAKNVSVQRLIDRLVVLENKIENGELDYVADRDKEIARLTAENERLREEVDSLSHENDELEYKTEKFEAENAELRATLSKMETVEKELCKRLEKAVELETELVYRIIENEFIGCTPITSLRVYEVMQLKRYGYFTDRAEAEKKLAELKGEKK